MRRTIIISVLMIAMLMLSSCITGDMESTHPVEGTIISITKNGNAITDITMDEAMRSGFDYGDIVTIKAENYTADAPIGTAFSDVDTGKTIVLMGDDGVVLAINFESFAEKSKLAEGAAITLTMKEKAGYLEEFNLRNLIRSDSREDFDSDEMFANFRNVAIGSIVPGRLYRSCSPVSGDARAPYAESLIESAGIRTVINLADSIEEASANMGNSPYYKEITDEGNAIFLDMTADFFTEESQKKTAEAVRFMIAGEAPYLIHCIEGQNRAGLMCAFIEALCGANIDGIVSDYMQSFTNYYGVQAGTKQYESISKTVTDFFQTMNGRAFPWNAVGKVAEIYAVNELGLSEEEIALLRNKLTK